MQPLTLNVSGMSCGHCVARVTRTLEALDGVEVDAVEIGRADVHFDPDAATADAIARALDDIGFPATPAAR
ncbi:MAG: heavy-metal-associated domain-containing protein [Acidobacteria bacterium]|nr:heavy-metal-associated domain-containing protein [Acidobacteriota bacterium]